MMHFKKTVVLVGLASCFCACLACHSSGEDTKALSRLDKMKEMVRLKESSIEYYGKIIDQHGLPVEGVEIEIQLSRYGVNPQTSFLAVDSYSLKTDKNGSFSIKRKRGFSCSVYGFKKVGYEFDRNRTWADYDKAIEVSPYSRIDQPNSANYEYGNKPKASNPATPALFYMRKKGEMTFVVSNRDGGGFYFLTRDSGSRKARDFILPEDRIGEKDLTDNRKKDGSVWMYDRYLQFPDIITQATYDSKKGVWTMTLTPQGHGAGILISDQLLYEAPASGYQSSYTFTSDTFAKTYAHCINEDASDKYGKPAKGIYLYIRSREPAIYTRVRINRFVANKEEIRLNGDGWVTNPYGERNLEKAEDLPFAITNKLEEEIRHSYRDDVNGRPAKPDLTKLLQEWEKNRPIADKVKDWLKR